MNSKDCELQDSLASAHASQPSVERYAQVIWMLGLVSPVPVVFYPLLIDLQRIQSVPVYIFGILIWCIALLVFVAMVLSRWDKFMRFPDTRTSQILFVAGIACYLFSIATWSIGIATLGWTLHAGAWLATHSGLNYSNRWKLLAHWPAACVLLHFPEIVETKLALAYQQLLFRVTAACLDALRIPFRSDDLTFEFARTTLFVDEVLVNVLSLTWMLFVSCLIVAWLRRPIVLLPVYLSVALFWTLGIHLVQLTVLGIARQQYQLDFSTGWLSIMLTATTLVMAVVSLISSDRCLQILFMPVPLDDSSRGPLNPINRGWNWLLLPLADVRSMRT